MQSKKGNNREKFVEIGVELCELLGMKSDDPNTSDTPFRFADFWTDFVSYGDGNTDTVFPAPENSGWVVVKNIKGMSMCEHHLLPFLIDVTIGYKPTVNILGLSKFARITKKYATRPQTQERLGEQVLDHILRVSACVESFTIIDGFHLCMYGRGVESDARTKTIHVSDWMGNDENHMSKIHELVSL